MPTVERFFGAFSSPSRAPLTNYDTALFGDSRVLQAWDCDPSRLTINSGVVSRINPRKVGGQALVQATTTKQAKFVAAQADMGNRPALNFDHSTAIMVYTPETNTIFPVAKTSAVTISIAAPGVVTWNAHGLIAGQRLKLSTDGALPTGLTAGTIYYVVSPTTNTFSLAASAGGTAITTTGTQSGTHTATVAGDFTIAFIGEYPTAAGTTFLGGGTANITGHTPTNGISASVQNTGLRVGISGSQASVVAPASKNVPHLSLYTWDDFAKTVGVAVDTGPFITATNAAAVSNDPTFSWGALISGSATSANVTGALMILGCEFLTGNADLLSTLRQFARDIFAVNT